MPRTRLAVAVLLVGSLALPACAPDSNIERRRRAPTVEIISPTDLAVFRQGDGPIDFNGLVFDSAQPATTLHVEWEIDDGGEPYIIEAAADEDGFVPLSLVSEALPLGEHSATLHAIDNDDAHGSASVRFIVAGPFGAPTVTITAPADGTEYDEGEAITFIGEAADVTTPVEDLVFRWFADGDELPGAISADGRSVLLWSDLLAGLRTIELRVTDEDGDVGADRVGVLIGEDLTTVQPGDVVFSEMNVNPEVVEDEVGEWVELFNTSGRSINLNGYTFRDDDQDEWVLQGDLVVAPGGYFVLCANISPETNGGVPCDGHFNRDWEGNGIALGNGDDELVLTRPDGVEIDWLHYDDTWYTPGVAIGVHPDHLDGGDNDDPAHWCPQTTIISTGGEPGTPGMVNDPC
jgi:hypothetical protein